MRVLVTGASGFVGREVCARLGADHEVIASSRTLSSPPKGASKLVNPGDINSKTDWSGALIGVEAVVHLAARVHITQETASDPLEAFRDVNTRGTQRLAEACVACGVKRFVFLSTIGVYGEGQDSDYIGEGYVETDVAAPRNAYSQSKFEAEEELRKIEGLESVVLRPAPVYGANTPASFGFLARLIKSGKPLPLKGVKNRRTIVSLANLADFIALSLTHPGSPGEIWHVTDRSSLKMESLCSEMYTAAGNSPKLFWVPEGLVRIAATALGKKNMYQQLWGSIVVNGARARTELGWTAPETFEDGIKKVMS